MRRAKSQARSQIAHIVGLTETAGAGNAPGNDRSGTWGRVAEWLSGANWGSHFLPRIGSEVPVDFLGADIDRPIIVGQAYNGADLPPFSAGHEAGANHSGRHPALCRRPSVTTRTIRAGMR